MVAAFSRTGHHRPRGPWSAPRGGHRPRGPVAWPWRRPCGPWWPSARHPSTPWPHHRPRGGARGRGHPSAPWWPIDAMAAPVWPVWPVWRGPCGGRGRTIGPVWPRGGPRRPCGRSGPSAPMKGHHGRPWPVWWHSGLLCHPSAPCGGPWRRWVARGGPVVASMASKDDPRWAMGAVARRRQGRVCLTGSFPTGFLRLSVVPAEPR